MEKYTNVKDEVEEKKEMKNFNFVSELEEIENS